MTFHEGAKHKYQTYRDVNINGKFSLLTDKRSRYNIFGPLSDSMSSTDTCQQVCINQDECNAIRGNKCVSSFDPQKKSCFCSFSKKKKYFTEPFYGMSQQEKTTQSLMSMARGLDNGPKPCWEYPGTQNKYSLIPLYKYPWSSLNIPDNNNMAFSFWIYLGDDVNSEANHNGFFYLKVKDCSCWLWIQPDKNKMLGYGNLQNNRFYMPVGPRDTTWITVNFRPGVQHIYLNGILTHSSTAPVTNPNNVGSGLYLTPRKGVFIKDLKFYDHFLTEETIGILYKGLKSSLDK